MEVSDELLPPVPMGTRPLKHQVGGHVFGKGKTKLGMLESADGLVLKPCQGNHRGERELSFYQSVFDSVSGHLHSLQPLLPRFYGTWSAPEHPGVVYMKLEDITRSYTKPCVLDIKVGPVTYDPDAGPEKRASEMSKYPAKQVTGFSVIGVKVVNPSYDNTLSLTSSELRHYTSQQILNQVLCPFFTDHQCIRQALVKSFINRLNQVKAWFLSQNSLHFYASSVLCVYDSAVLAHHPCYNNGPCQDCCTAFESGIESHLDLRMIDFTHIFPGDAPDTNYLQGLQGIEEYFLKVLDVAPSGSS